MINGRRRVKTECGSGAGHGRWGDDDDSRLLLRRKVEGERDTKTNSCFRGKERLEKGIN